MIKQLKAYSGFIAVALVLLFFVGRYFYMKPSVSNGEVVVDFSARLINGQDFQLSELRGQYVLLDFWGSWCAPCRVENPQLVKFYQQFSDKVFTDGRGLTVVSVAIEKDTASWKRAIEKDDLLWSNHILDTTTSLKFFDGSISKQFGVKQVPTKLLINPQGIIIAVNDSFQVMEQLLLQRLPK